MSKQESSRGAHSVSVVFLFYCVQVLYFNERQKLLLSLKIDMNLSNTSVSSFLFYYAETLLVYCLLLHCLVSSPSIQCAALFCEL